MSAPLLQQTSPADNLSNVAVTANLVLTFNQIVKLGTSGSIRIYKSDGTLVHTISITDASQVSLEIGSRPEKVTINPNIDLQPGTGYYVLIDAGVVENRSGEDFAGISSPTAFNFTTAGSPPGGGDTTAPTLTTTTPLDNATGVAVGANLVLTFNEAVKAGSGVIQIRRVSDESLVKTIDVTDATQVSFSGNQVTINPATDLPAGTAFYVTMTAEAVRDLANTNSGGISSSTEFNFTTANAPPGDTTPPQLLSTSPLDGTTDVAVGTNIVLTFDEAVKAGTGNIEFRNAVNGNIEKAIAVTDASQVSFSGSQLTIDPSSDFVEGVNYYVVMGAGVVADLADNPFAGIASPTVLNFSTPLLDLNGTSDDDTLNGTNRNELIDGSTGVDMLLGGLGDDTYIIANQEGGENSLYVEREPGSGDPGEIFSYILEPGDITAQLFDFTGDSFVDFIHFYYNGWVLDFSTTELDENLAPGTYEDAEYANNPSPGHPGIAVSGPGLGSIGAYGSFTITDAVFDYSGDSPALVSFSVSFIQYSDSWGDQAYTGTLNFAHTPAGPATIDTITEYENEGIDTVRAALSYTLGPNLENLTLTGSDQNYDGTGNEFDNIIIGTSGNNVIDGGLGVDTMIGSYGTDTYIVDNVGDVVTEVFDTASLNADVVKSSITFVLGDYFEQLILTGSAAHQWHGQRTRQRHHRKHGQQRFDRRPRGWTVSWEAAATTPSRSLPAQEATPSAIFQRALASAIVVVLDGFALGSFTAVHAAMTQIGSNTVLNLGDGETLTFLNVLKGAFAADDFTFVNVQPVRSGPVHAAGEWRIHEHDQRLAARRQPHRHRRQQPARRQAGQRHDDGACRRRHVSRRCVGRQRGREREQRHRHGDLVGVVLHAREQCREPDADGNEPLTPRTATASTI